MSANGQEWPCTAQMKHVETAAPSLTALHSLEDSKQGYNRRVRRLGLAPVLAHADFRQAYPSVHCASRDSPKAHIASMVANNVFPLDGGCDCAVVRYRMVKQPLFVHCCHCRWCQRESGASFALNAMVEADYVVHMGAEPEIIDTPSNSGKGQKIARCPQCRVAVWSNYAGAGPVIRFVRVGTLDAPDHLPPDIHIFTSSKQPWVQLPADVPSVAEYYERESYWPPESLARRRLILPQIKAYEASIRSG